MLTIKACGQSVINVSQMQGQKENSWVMKPNYDLVHSSKRICILFTFVDASLHNSSAWQILFQNTNHISYYKMPHITQQNNSSSVHPNSFLMTVLTC